ncbi:MAG: FAD binding domain-containing protein [Saprospirales bacterium]|nr:FAD binding domain-containing protein [Saprospirales bacterium]
MLIEAALSVGAPLLRKTATLGGNVLCENRCLYYNQSEWWRESVGYCLKCDGDICIATQGKKACFSELVSDTAPALIAMDAEIEVIDLDGARRVKLEDIYTGDGVKPRNLPETAIVTAILLPLDRGFSTSYFKLRQRESLEFTSLTAAIALDKTGKLKIALSGVDPKPVVVVGKKDDDPEGLIKKAIKGARAIDNDMYTRKYRREMIGVYLRRGLEKL